MLSLRVSDHLKSRYSCNSTNTLGNVILIALPMIHAELLALHRLHVYTEETFEVSSAVLR